MHNRLTSHNRLSIAVIILCVTQVLSLAALAVVWMRSDQEPESLVVIYYDDPFIAKRADEFDLPQVIMQYDQVIDGIEKFYQDKGYYPPDLEILVPDYLSKAPGIHIRRGERLTYRPEPMSLYDEVTPFTFNLYGHYPGAAFMHGWYLYYCPAEYDGCNNHGNRHTRQFRINDRWVWINSSAL